MEELIVKFSMLLMCLNLLTCIVLKVNKIKPRFNTLSCGLVGYCGDGPADPNIIRLLLMFNMDRGEDSTGWAINNIITKDTEKVSLFIRKNKLTISPDDENYSIICHARKASSGARTQKELAHPFGMYKDGVEKEKYDLILAMNGTFDLLPEYCKEFEKEYKPHVNSDTQMLARIMCDLGEKEYMRALERYKGAATLLFMSPKYPNTLMAYKDPERPLFFWQKEKNEMYISSMKEALDSVAWEGATIEAFTDGKLFRINKGKITKSVDVDRTNPIKTISSYRSTPNYNPGPNLNNRKNSIANWNSSIEEEELPNVGKSAHENTKVHSVKGNRIYLYCDRYWENGHPVSGPKNINDKGDISTTEREGFEKMYFLFGYLCSSEEKYREISEILTKEGTKGEKKEIDLEKFKKTRISTLCEYFKYPATTYIDAERTQLRWILNTEWSEKLNSDKKLEIDFFLSNALITLKSTGRKTQGNKNSVCEEDSVRLKSKAKKHDPALTSVNSVLDSVKLRYPERESKEEIKRRMIKMGVGGWPQTLYNDIKVNYWMVNNSSDLDDHYYSLLFDIFSSLNIAPESDLVAILTSGKRNYTDTGFLSEVKTLQDITIKYYESMGKKLGDLNPEEPKEDDIKIIDIIDALNDFHERDKKSKVDMISIQKSNYIFSDENFKREFFEATNKEIAGFHDNWISNEPHPAELDTLHEALILGLVHVGRMTEEDLEEFCQYPHDTALLKKIASNYAAYANNVRSKIMIGDVLTGDDDESDTDPEQINETFDAEDYQKDMVNAYLDIMNQFRENINITELYEKDFELTPDTIDIKDSMKYLAELMSKKGYFENKMK